MDNKAQGYETERMDTMYGMYQEEDEDENQIRIPIKVNPTK